ncbi:hypothetical protein [Pedobacter punctiformis]|uniref:Alpha-L-fucosidase C-terminal domain-containing protein n=1 Tax=Pedobacter punctiformis TaxID=3004097 RepID=A0ABT4L8D4_9SPHI|nr:hypothetical protein [Pedobacter sp. HCMS5-2]MCZ4244185.1 hypothetical protein [Pedobacter sp. HCMS5-2]
MTNELTIKEVNPMIFYSGKQDEVQILLKAAETGELIVKSLTTEIMKVSDVSLDNDMAEISWHQDMNGLKISMPNQLPVLDNDVRILKVKFKD